MQSVSNCGSSYLQSLCQSSPRQIMHGLLGAALIYQLFDQAIANLIALETYRQGTSLFSYPRIFFCGSSTNTRPLRWIWDDSLSAFRRTGRLKDKVKIYYELNANGPARDSGKAHLQLCNNYWIALFLTTVSPTIKYRFIPNKIVFSDTNFAFPKEVFSPTHQGITGSLIQGLNRGVFSRIRAKPEKFAVGFLELMAAVVLASLFFNIKAPFLQCDRLISTLRKVDDFNYKLYPLLGAMGRAVSFTFLTMYTP